MAEHKTASTFGQAGVVLTREEYNWFLRFNAIRHMLPGYTSQATSPKYFFFNSAGGEMVKLGEMMGMVFNSIQINGVTTNIIRASIATMVSAAVDIHFISYPMVVGLCFCFENILNNNSLLPGRA